MTQNPARSLQPFFAMDILAAAKARETEGKQVLHLELGEPGALPAKAVRDAAAAALDHPQRYTHAKGHLELRQRLSRYYAENHGIQVDPERILVCMGSSAGFILAFLAAFEPGARIAVTRPYYPAYLNILNGLGFEPVEIALNPENNWHLTPELLSQAHADTPFDGLLFASPANPTGAVVSADELKALTGWCSAHKVQFVSDEIYHGLDYSGRSVSAGETDADAILINSFSKYHCMTGWRIGWLVLPERLVRKTEILQQNFFISAPSLSQTAALAAMDATQHAEEQKNAYAINRDLLICGLDDLGFGVAQGEGAFYAYADASRFTNDSLQFCADMLEQIGVATAPGVDFDRVNGNRFVRFSYAGTKDSIEAALKKMAGYLPRP